MRTLARNELTFQLISGNFWTNGKSLILKSVIFD